MRTRHIFAAALFMLAGQAVAQTPIYKQANAPIEERVKDLLERMTPEEKRRNEMESIISGILWTFIVALYLLLGFVGDVWAYSWIIFIIGAALQNVVNLLFKLREK